MSSGAGDSQGDHRKLIPSSPSSLQPRSGSEQRIIADVATSRASITSKSATCAHAPPHISCTVPLHGSFFHHFHTLRRDAMRRDAMHMDVRTATNTGNFKSEYDIVRRGHVRYAARDDSLCRSCRIRSISSTPSPVPLPACLLKRSAPDDSASMSSGKREFGSSASVRFGSRYECVRVRNVS